MEQQEEGLLPPPSRFLRARLMAIDRKPRVASISTSSTSPTSPNILATPQLSGLTSSSTISGLAGPPTITGLTSTIIGLNNSGLTSNNSSMEGMGEFSFKRDWSSSRSSSWSSSDSTSCPSLSPCSSSSLSLPPSPPMHSNQPKRRPSAALSITIPDEKPHAPSIDRNTVIYEPSTPALESFPKTGIPEPTTTEAYPDGPIEVCGPNIYLYSEPTAQEAIQFDVVINVAKEVPNPFAAPEFEDAEDCSSIYSSCSSVEAVYHSPPSSVESTPCLADSPWTPNKNPNISISSPTPCRPEYVYVPWDHNSQLVSELSELTALIRARSDEGKRVLIHCQCGVSRSASLVVAYMMKRNAWDLNTAYRYVKSKSPFISPNMALIYQLVDWQHMLRHG
ncbi:hypothetical protein TRVA0_024S01926 [Trichomonascus vanleenenianus]|uniref:dual specificity protein phosphatase family protein n=1 Tax=Trichomonascus vanleenenianus TaxID=2268995 RepID=UPI003ECB7BB7